MIYGKNRIIIQARLDQKDLKKFYKLLMKKIYQNT